MRRSPVGCALAVVAVAVWALPAHGAQVSVGKYVNSVCNSLNTFRDDVDEIASSFEASASASTSLDGVKTEFVAFFDEMVDATQEFSADLEQAGSPKIKKGGKIASALRAGIAEMESLITDARGDAAALSTADPQQFTADAQELSEQLDDAFDEIGDGFDTLDTKYDTSSLEKAQNKDPDCELLH